MTEATSKSRVDIIDTCVARNTSDAKYVCETQKILQLLNAAAEEGTALSSHARSLLFCFDIQERENKTTIWQGHSFKLEDRTESS